MSDMKVSWPELVILAYAEGVADGKEHGEKYQTPAELVKEHWSKSTIAGVLKDDGENV